MQENDNRFRSLRIEANLTQKQIADMTDTTQANITRIEKGNTAPSLKMQLWYADYFDVSLDYIYNRTDERKVYDPNKRNEIITEFIEACFENESSIILAKLKESLIKSIGRKGQGE